MTARGNAIPDFHWLQPARLAVLLSVINSRPRLRGLLPVFFFLFSISGDICFVFKAPGPGLDLLRVFGVLIRLSVFTGLRRHDLTARQTGLTDRTD